MLLQDTKFIATVVGIICLTVVSFIAINSNIDASSIKEVIRDTIWGIVALGGGYGYLQSKKENKTL